MKKIKFNDLKKLVKTLLNGSNIPCMCAYKDSLNGKHIAELDAAILSCKNNNIVISWTELSDFTMICIVFTEKSEYYFENGHFIFTKSDGMEEENDIVELHISLPKQVLDVF